MYLKIDNYEPGLWPKLTDRTPFISARRYTSGEVRQNPTGPVSSRDHQHRAGPVPIQGEEDATQSSRK